MSCRRRLVLIAAAAAGAGLTAVPTGAVAASGFGPLSGTGGCVASLGAIGEPQGSECAEGKGLLGANAVAVSPDGANVYVVGGTPGDRPSQSFGDLAILKRDATTGGLKPVGCLSTDGTDGRDGQTGACTQSPSLLGADGVAVSPDGSTVYVTSMSSASIVAFAREPATGALTRLGCLQGSPRSGSPCRGGNAFVSSGAVVTSADNTAVYFAAPQEGAISAVAGAPPPAPAAGEPAPPTAPSTAASAFTTPAALTYIANPCIAVNGMDGECAVGTAMRGLGSLALSPDGKQLYGVAAGSRAIDVFSTGAGGALTQTGCLLVAGPLGLCGAADFLKDPTTVIGSPDGKNLYVTDSTHEGGRIVVLARDAITGQLSQAGCQDHLPKPRTVRSEIPGETAEEKEELEREEREVEEESKHPAHSVCEQGPGLTSLNVLALSGDGSALYAFGTGSATVFSRDATTGKLSETSCVAAEDSRCASVASLGDVQGAAVSADGREVYVVGSGKVVTFSIGAAVTSARAATSRSGRASVRVACPAGLPRSCSGRVMLTGTLRQARRHARRRPRARRVALGASSRFSIAPGHQALVGVRLSGTARRLLRSRGHLRLTAVVHADPSGGGSGYGRHLTLTLARS